MERGASSLGPTTDVWPSLPLDAWSDTLATLHRWLQIAGKIRLVQTPWVNHSWHTALYVTARGLTTSPIAYEQRTFELVFDFVDHVLAIQTSQGDSGRVALEPQSVAAFYSRLMEELERLGIRIAIYKRPCEIADAVPFDEDLEHEAYDREYANRFWRILAQTDRVLRHFRAGFIGKCSPVHFFWGAPDLAVTRFSGRRAPEHPGGIPNLADRVTREAYSHEVSSCGFWPGGGPVSYPAFYSYAYPEPTGFSTARVGPEGAYYHETLREFLLPYDVVREAKDPDAALMKFVQTTYEAAADLGGWDRAALERVPKAP